jgi:DNA-binding transcriptional regulator GbsR (MarR family)
MKNEELERFVESWGSMGILWGINRSMARIHAFLMLAEEAVDSETISDELNISRGNVSMCLKELRNWGVIQRIHKPGDRRDLYVIEPDTWTMLYRIASGRKSREFDPAYNALKHLMAEVDTEKTEKVHKRLTELEEILLTVDKIIGSFLESEEKSRNMLEFLKKFAK